MCSTAADCAGLVNFGCSKELKVCAPCTLGSDECLGSSLGPLCCLDLNRDSTTCACSPQGQDYADPHHQCRVSSSGPYCVKRARVDVAQCSCSLNNLDSKPKQTCLNSTQGIISPHHLFIPYWFDRSPIQQIQQTYSPPINKWGLNSHLSNHAPPNLSESFPTNWTQKFGRLRGAWRELSPHLFIKGLYSTYFWNIITIQTVFSPILLFCRLLLLRSPDLRLSIQFRLQWRDCWSGVFSI
jgi:hypothetical protein